MSPLPSFVSFFLSFSLPTSLDIVFRLPIPIRRLRLMETAPSLSLSPILILSATVHDDYFPKTVLEAETSLGNESPR